MPLLSLVLVVITISQSSTLLFILYLSKFTCFVYLVFYISMFKHTTFNTFSKRTQPTTISIGNLSMKFCKQQTSKLTAKRLVSFSTRSFSLGMKILVRYSSYQKVKACRISSEIYKVQKLYTKSLVIQTFQNNFGFSLYTMPFIYYIVITLEN